jgi:predicted dinucleotide-binding enzyme
MKIGILGSGDVAKTLGGGFLKHGHAVKMGTRDPAKLVAWGQQNPGAQIGGFAAAAMFGELVVLAVKGSASMEALRAAAENGALEGKTVIDATNPIAEGAPSHGVLKFFTNLDESLLERLQREYPNVRLVKAFNSVGNSRMINPDFDVKPTMFICGNDADAKRTVTRVLDQFGWETADMGMAEAARAIEPLCMLWCIPGFLHNQWSHAFKLLK